MVSRVYPRSFRRRPVSPSPAWGEGRMGEPDAGFRRHEGRAHHTGNLVRLIPWVSLLVAAMYMGAAGAADMASGYPSRPVRLIVGQPAGGNADMTARVYGQKLGERLGVQFVVDNRGGAGGVIAT